MVERSPAQYSAGAFNIVAKTAVKYAKQME